MYCYLFIQMIICQILESNMVSVQMNQKPKGTFFSNYVYVELISNSLKCKYCFHFARLKR